MKKSPDASLHKTSKISLALIIVLLFLRIPLLFMGQYGLIDENLALAIYLCATYLFTCVFICFNRSHLYQYHITYSAIGLILLSPTLALVFDQDDFTVWVRLGISLVCAGYLVLNRSDIKVCSIPGKTIAVNMILIVILSVVVPLVIHAATGFQRYQGNEPVTMSAIADLWFFQLSYAAVSEEPLFRGFIMGYLRNKGMNGFSACLIQAAIFWMGHIYYFNTGINFWIIHPLLALLLGLVAWKMKSISYSTVLHASVNALGDILKYIPF